ncbi:5'-methylthioadenosine/adenosylhomocysteine nucleosidase [Buchnera aphidicola (Kurisakia onigurumii)]|uniref:5'-methylthioadenosine/adenosylhomocysteine nucleosidase n=1 Tax=Buchnera aphidicola TaxID=9 RepID=UPI0031B6D413
MSIAIIGAMEEEINILKKNIIFLKNRKIKNFSIYTGYLYGKKIILIKSGIGKVSACIATTYLIIKFKPKFIINIGFSGSINKNIKINDIVLPKKISYHDVDVTTFNYKIGQVPKYPKTFHVNKKLFNIMKKSTKELNYKYFSGLNITGDTFIYTKKQKNYLQKIFPNAISVDMESASIQQVCFYFNVKCIFLRIISDLSNKKSKIDLKNNYLQKSKKIFLIIKKFFLIYK